MDEQEVNQPVEDGNDAAPDTHEMLCACANDNAVSEDDNGAVFTPGDVINDSYRIVSLIGRGGMGEVYRAKNIELGFDVALKVVSKTFSDGNSHALDLLRNEAKKSAALRHKNIVSVQELKREPRKDVWYLVMEYVDGGSLHAILDRQQTVSEEQAVVIVQEVANALNVASELKIAHRDIKPDNILFTSRGEVKLADLGIARHYGSASSNATKTVLGGFNVGTPAYLAPEQIIDPENYDVRSDIYSLGVTFYEMITGRLPFDKKMPELAGQIIGEQPPDPRELNPQITEWCAKLVMSMLEKDPEKRLGTPKELIEMIDAGPHTFNGLQRMELMAKLVAGEHATVIDARTSWASSKFKDDQRSMQLFKISMAIVGLSVAVVVLSIATLGIMEWHKRRVATISDNDERSVKGKIIGELNIEATTAKEQIFKLLEEIARRIDVVVEGQGTAGLDKAEDKNKDYDKAIVDVKETRKRFGELLRKLEGLSEKMQEDKKDKEYAIQRAKFILRALDVTLEVQGRGSNAGKIYRDFANGDRTARNHLKEITDEVDAIQKIASGIEEDSLNNSGQADQQQIIEFLKKMKAVEKSLAKSKGLIKEKLDAQKAAEPKPVSPKPAEETFKSDELVTIFRTDLEQELTEAEGRTAELLKSETVDGIVAAKALADESNAKLDGLLERLKRLRMADLVDDEVKGDAESRLNGRRKMLEVAIAVKQGHSEVMRISDSDSVKEGDLKSCEKALGGITRISETMSKEVGRSPDMDESVKSVLDRVNTIAGDIRKQMAKNREKILNKYIEEAEEKLVAAGNNAALLFGAENEARIDEVKNEVFKVTIEIAKEPKLGFDLTDDEKLKLEEVRQKCGPLENDVKFAVNIMLSYLKVRNEYGKLIKSTDADALKAGIESLGELETDAQKERKDMTSLTDQADEKVQKMRDWTNEIRNREEKIKQIREVGERVIENCESLWTKLNSQEKDKFHWIDAQLAENSVSSLGETLKKIKTAVAEADEVVLMKKRQEFDELQAVLSILCSEKFAKEKNANELLDGTLAKKNSSDFCTKLDELAKAVSNCRSDASSELLGALSKNLGSFEERLKISAKTLHAKERREEIGVKLNELKNALEKVSEGKLK